MSTQNVKANLADHAAIRDLIDRYTDAVNRRDWRALEATFAAGGIWDCHGPTAESRFLFEGARNVADGIAGAVQAGEMCIQMNHAVVIDVQGDRASATCTLNEMFRMPDGNGMELWGIYYDDIARGADGEWRFEKRRFRTTYYEMRAFGGGLNVRFPVDPRTA
ncbi:MAG: nuclear transport factor 2 family protein [Gammaproteobacteria bacterium]